MDPDLLTQLGAVVQTALFAVFFIAVAAVMLLLGVAMVRWTLTGEFRVRARRSSRGRSRRR